MQDQSIDIGITKAALAQEVTEFIFDRINFDVDASEIEFTDLVLDVQDIFSDYWDGPEVDEDE